LPWGGGGGSGGDYTVKTLAVTEGQVIHFHIGQGGSGGQLGQPGQPGGTTWVIDQSTMRAAGGSGGKPGSNDEGPGYALDGPHDNEPADVAVWGTLGGGAYFEENNSGGGGGGCSGDESGLPGLPGEGRPGGSGLGGVPGGTGGKGGNGGYHGGQLTTAGEQPGGGGGGGGNQLIDGLSPTAPDLSLSFSFVTVIRQPPDFNTPAPSYWFIFPDLSQVGTFVPPYRSTSIGFALKHTTHLIGDGTNHTQLLARDSHNPQSRIKWIPASAPYTEGLTVDTSQQPCVLFIGWNGNLSVLVAHGPFVYEGDYWVTDSRGGLSAAGTFRFQVDFQLISDSA
jgi:hypothetical protein